MTEDQVLLSRAMRRLLPMKTQKTVPRPQVGVMSCRTNLETIKVGYMCGVHLRFLALIYFLFRSESFAKTNTCLSYTLLFLIFT